MPLHVLEYSPLRTRPPLLPADMATNASLQESEDLPPLLVASFASPNPAARTITAYVHFEPFMLSSLREPFFIAEPQAPPRSPLSQMKFMGHL